MSYVNEQNWNPLNIEYGSVTQGEHQKKILILNSECNKDNERKKDDKHKKLKIRLRANSYGIGDFKGDKKFKMSLYNLTQELITKMIEFEGAVVDSAVLNSVDWFGEDLSKLKAHQFNGALKYGKDKNTKQPDHSRPFL